MAHRLAIQLLCFGGLPLLLLTAGDSRASETHLQDSPTGEQAPLSPATPIRSVLCRFVRGPQAGRQKSTCIAEHLAAGFYRQIALCSGVDSCVLKVPAMNSLRLWSPDSRTQFTTLTTPLLSSYTFPIFDRTAKVTKGPWITGAAQKTMVVRWETDRKASSWLRVVNNQFTPPHLSRWIQGRSSCPSGDNKPCIHSVFVNDLRADHRYSYLLGDVQPNATTGLHPSGRLTTEPIVPSNAEFSFSVVGDVQGEGGNAWKDVVDYTASLQSITGRAGGPVLHTGDMTYHGTGEEEFFSLAHSTLSQHPFFPALGNNDNQAWFLSYFGSTGRTDPLNDSRGLNPYYALNYGNTHFIFLDSNSLKSCQDAQAKWLSDDLQSPAALKAENIVVVSHWGPRGYGVYADHAVLRDCLVSLFKDQNGKPTNFFRKLRIVFSGHQHYYERIGSTTTIAGEKRTIYYITVGSAGAAPRCPGEGPDLVMSSAGNCRNPNESPSDGRFDYQGIVVDVRGRDFEVRAYNFAYDASGQRVASGSGDTWYSTLDCFAMNAKDESIPPQNVCAP